MPRCECGFRLVDAIGKRQRARAREAAEQQVAADTRRLLELRLALYDEPEVIR
jgi:hypothetical protein